MDTPQVLIPAQDLAMLRQFVTGCNSLKSRPDALAQFVAMWAEITLRETNPENAPKVLATFGAN